MELAEIQKNALALSEQDRATLAAELLSSLPATLLDDDEGVAEARRRSLELDQDPLMGCTWEEIRRGVQG